MTTKPSQAKPSQAKPSQAKPSQAKPSQAKPSQAKPENHRSMSEKRKRLFEKNYVLLDIKIKTMV